MIAALERNHRRAAAAAAASVALAQTPLAMAGECALFVTAHPDDETMFFAPAILSLLQSMIIDGEVDGEQRVA